jgi:hypothetical protein
MGVSGARELALIGAAASFIFGTTNPSYAQGMAPSPFPQHGIAVPDGLAAMVHVVVPVGDDKPDPRDKRRVRRSNRTVTLSFGTSWRDQTGSPDFTGPRYLSTLEAGVTFDGDPVLKFGDVDLVKKDEDQR